MSPHPLSAVLLAVLKPERAQDSDFWSWYEADHVAGRLTMPGFGDFHRYRGTEDPSQGLIVYELDSMDALKTTEYKELQAATATTTKDRMGGLDRFVRVTGEAVQSHGGIGGSSPVLFVVAFDAPSNEVEELDAWYEEEHAPMLLEATAWSGVQLIDVADANVAWTRVAIHWLDDATALESPERLAAGRTARRQEMSRRRWFQDSERFTLHRVDRFDEPHESS